MTNYLFRPPQFTNLARGRVVVHVDLADHAASIFGDVDAHDGFKLSVRVLQYDRQGESRRFPAYLLNLFLTLCVAFENPLAQVMSRLALFYCLVFGWPLRASG